MTVLAYKDIARPLPGRECLSLVRTDGNHSRRYDRGVAVDSDSHLIGFHARVCQRARLDHIEESGPVDHLALWTDDDPIIANDVVECVDICFDDCLGKLPLQRDQLCSCGIERCRPFARYHSASASEQANYC